MTLTMTELLTLLTVVVAFTAIVVTVILWFADKHIQAKPNAPKITVRQSIVKRAPRYIRVNIHFEANDEPWSVESMLIKVKPFAPVYDLTDLYNFDSSGTYTLNRDKLRLASAKSEFLSVGILENPNQRHSFTIGLIIDTNEMKKPIKMNVKIYLSLDAVTKKRRKITVKRLLSEHTNRA